MIEETEAGESRAGTQAAAVGMAMSEATRDPSLAEEARVFLREQSELSRLQKSILAEEAKLNLSHLRFRRFGDVTKAMFEIAGGLLALVVVLGLAAGTQAEAVALSSRRSPCRRVSSSLYVF